MCIIFWTLLIHSKGAIMRQIKNKAKEIKRDNAQAKPESRMNQLLQQIDQVISKKNTSDSRKKTSK